MGQITSNMNFKKKRSMIPSSPKPTTFTYFHKLPIELRFQIWRYLMPKPQVVDLIPWRRNQQTTPEPPPVLLHICRESRQEALRSGIIVLAPRPGKSEPTLWFNANTDMLFMSADRKTEVIRTKPGKTPGLWGWRRLGPAARQIRHLGTDSLGIWPGNETKNLELWRTKLPSLETIVFSDDWGTVGDRSHRPLILKETSKGQQGLIVMKNFGPWTERYEVAPRVFKYSPGTWMEVK